MTPIQLGKTNTFSNLDVFLAESLSLESSQSRTGAFNEQLQIANRRSANDPEVSSRPEPSDRLASKYDNRDRDREETKISESKKRQEPDDDKQRTTEPVDEENRQTKVDDAKSHHEPSTSDANDESRESSETNEESADSASQEHDDNNDDDSNVDPAAAAMVAVPQEEDIAINTESQDAEVSLRVTEASDANCNEESDANQSETSSSDGSTTDANNTGISGEIETEQLSNGTATPSTDESNSEETANSSENAANPGDQTVVSAATTETTDTKTDDSEETPEEAQASTAETDDDAASTAESESSRGNGETSSARKKQGESLTDRKEDRIEDAAKDQQSDEPSDRNSAATTGPIAQNANENTGSQTQQTATNANTAVAAVDSSGMQQQSGTGSEQQNSGDRPANTGADSIQGTNRTQANNTSGSSGTSGTTSADQARFLQRVERAFHTMLRRGDDTIRLRLSPPELGSLRMEITVKNGEMTAKIQTDSEKARTMLLDNLPALRDRLSEQDIKIHRFDVERTDYNATDQSNHQATEQETWQGSGNGGNQSEDNRRTPTAPAADFEPVGTTEDPNTFNPGALDIMV